MLPDPTEFAALLSAETGLPFTGRRRRSDDQDEIELVPDGHQAGDTFRLRASLRWRSVIVHFEPGAYAAGLMEAMRNASPEGRSLCMSVLEASVLDGADVTVSVGGTTGPLSSSALWNSQWDNFRIQLTRGQLEVNTGNPAGDREQLLKWTGRLGAAMLALMPVQADGPAGEDLSGFPEGAKLPTTVNRYERDRRNRAAALAIHGFRCKACDRLMSDQYGEIAATLIEVHHLTPVSELGPGYIINPATDLAPLCPNCHAVAHLRSPPFTVDELRIAASGR